MEPKSLAQTRADWITQGNISKMQAQLERETDADRRKSLEDRIAEQRKLITPG
jgi:hypothetical protein